MTNKKRGFELVKKEKRTLSDNMVKLPVRGTKTSAGYDFFATEDLIIPPQKTVKFKTDVKAYMGDEEVLLMDVRSSIGVGKDLMLVNTLGIIDSDYYENVDNDGNIMIGLRNLKPSISIVDKISVKDISGNVCDIPITKDLTVENTVSIKAGERVAQGIFVQYLEADNCNTEEERIGGVGSTNKDLKEDVK